MNNNKTVNNHPPAAADAELPAATWSRNHSGKLLHYYYIRQIKHKKTLPKMIRSLLSYVWQ